MYWNLRERFMAALNRQNFLPEWPIYIYCLKIKCTKFLQLILRKIIEIVVTGCQILRLKYTEFNFG